MLHCYAVMHRRHRDGRDLDSSVDSGQAATALRIKLLNCYIVTMFHCYISGFSRDWCGHSDSHRHHCFTKYITYSWLLKILPHKKHLLLKVKNITKELIKFEDNLSSHTESKLLCFSKISYSSFVLEDNKIYHQGL